MGIIYPSLSLEQEHQLLAVPLTNRIYRPCQVTLINGDVHDRVYLADKQFWFEAWGEGADSDNSKCFLRIRDVVEIRNSPSRLPASFANKLYAAGESGMGYAIFTVCFKDGSSLAVLSGDAIDFIDYPTGQSGATIVDVFPNVGRDNPLRSQAPRYAWCLHGGTVIYANGS